MIRAFSVIEMLVVVTIIGLVSLVIITPFAQFRNNQLLTGASEQMLATLNKARAKTLSSVASSQYGVHFLANQIVLFKGSSYPGTEPETILLDPLIQLSTISLAGGGSDVIFQRLTGKTSQSGTVTVSLVSNGSQSRTITVGSTG